MKNIIITGTSRGIGYELALQFANAGHNVLAISRKTPQALIAHSNMALILKTGMAMVPTISTPSAAHLIWKAQATANLYIPI
jgi:NAD(P)-dependent dehydrogenase (short-subunit alcohol dehydrogenase family)